METPDETESLALKARVEELERTIRDLKIRLLHLEQLLAPRTENPKDQAVVRAKVVYDWQK